ncbi:uncharacterized protein LACBIDRAFT_300297 [Laccaria bicolor S238N-H82]|uniref:Predicted protein n=1 Tax=Laccaria bicolor (strain S238N-H82 / ATCC MYA-4686) TaxID=486041 RepID=B0DGF4_LACBS|nr:uncharacterized protein LACBIDRAFT_300297 [Laccaria bicolor S238N-H82]EDR06143.1 predicted protein [Laccaria bicolor S238N-H82]|eukprot:XP_001883004.1 predicted protein [Laccaria bicolor S238N-H82]
MAYWTIQIICESHGCSFHHLLTLVQHHHSKSLQISEGTRYQSKQPRRCSSWLSPPPNHLMDHLRPQSTISRYRTTTYCAPPHLHIASMLALCPSLLSDSRPLPPLLVPLNETVAVVPLYSPSPFPLPCSGLHHSEAGVTGWA